MVMVNVIVHFAFFFLFFVGIWDATFLAQLPKRTLQHCTEYSILVAFLFFPLSETHETKHSVGPLHYIFHF